MMLLWACRVFFSTLVIIAVVYVVKRIRISLFVFNTTISFSYLAAFMSSAFFFVAVKYFV
jgi:hypothetical protein